MPDNLSEVYDANRLVVAFMEARKGVMWKQSVQQYGINLLQNIRETQLQLMNGTYTPRPMLEFELHERGHARHIKAQHIYDRVIQRSLNDNVLIPRIRPTLIYDNGASLKDKGLDFARKRFEVHLRKAYQKYGENAAILFMDDSKYFDNIIHEVALAKFRPFVNNSEYEFIRKTLDSFVIDISYLPQNERAGFMQKVFNNLEYSKIPESLKTGECYAGKSVGIGNQLAQITGIIYQHDVDFYCKVIKRIKFYGRYMDDTYVIMQNKEELKRLLKEIKGICDKLGIFVNEKKTHIYTITNWLTWLKINYKVLPTGKIIRKIHNATIRRERRRLRGFRKLLDNNRITFQAIEQCYKSWRGSYSRFDSGVKIHKLDKYFKSLFKEEMKNGKQRNDKTGTRCTAYQRPQKPPQFHGKQHR